MTQSLRSMTEVLQLLLIEGEWSIDFGGEEGEKEDVVGDRLGLDSDCESVNSANGTAFSGRSFELPVPSKAAILAWMAADGAMGRSSATWQARRVVTRRSMTTAAAVGLVRDAAKRKWRLVNSFDLTAPFT